MVALVLPACTTAPQTPATGPVAITPETSAALTSYLRAVGVTKPGAFAVSPDGRDSFYTYCENGPCAVSTYSIPAQQGCQSFSGTPCIILYVRSEQRLTFTRTETTGTGGQHGYEKQRELNFDPPGR